MSRSGRPPRRQRHASRVRPRTCGRPPSHDATLADDLRGGRRLRRCSRRPGVLDWQPCAGSCASMAAHRGEQGRMSMLIDVAQDRECRVALRVDCSLLGVPECTADVPLLRRSAGPGREHIVVRPYEPRGEPMTRERHPELPRDRHRPADPSVLVGWRCPRRSTCHANSISASSRSAIRTSVQVSPSNSETRAPVSAATVNSVR